MTFNEWKNKFISEEHQSKIVDWDTTVGAFGKSGIDIPLSSITISLLEDAANESTDLNDYDLYRNYNNSIHFEPKVIITIPKWVTSWSDVDCTIEESENGWVVINHSLQCSLAHCRSKVVLTDWLHGSDENDTGDWPEIED